MKLLAPVSSYESAKLQIESGASEIYVGGSTDIFHHFNFSGRGKYTDMGAKTYPEDMELIEIVKLAHQYDVRVMYAANFPFIADDPDGGRNYADAFLAYISKGIDAGVDSLILGDIGAILLCRQQKIKTHITASTFLETMNTDQVYLLKELGVNRVVLSYQIAMHEIQEIIRHNIMEIEVFGHYGCSFYDGYCNLKHFYGETKEDGIGTPCQEAYRLYHEDGEVMLLGNCFNFALLCSICSLQCFEQIGVTSIKLVGRTRDIHENARITKTYADAMKSMKNRNINLQEGLPLWWKRVYCNKGLCKYQDNGIYDDVITYKGH